MGYTRFLAGMVSFVDKILLPIWFIFINLGMIATFVINNDMYFQSIKGFLGFVHCL